MATNPALSLAPTTPGERDNGEKYDYAKPTEGPTVEANERYLSGMRLFLAFVGMLMSVLLVALDQTIVSFIASYSFGAQQRRWLPRFPSLRANSTLSIKSHGSVRSLVST
jgi:hypothetical protein